MSEPMVTQLGRGRTQVCQVSETRGCNVSLQLVTRVFKTVSDSLHTRQGLGSVNTLSWLSAGQLRQAPNKPLPGSILSLCLEHPCPVPGLSPILMPPWSHALCTSRSGTAWVRTARLSTNLGVLLCNPCPA